MSDIRSKLYFQFDPEVRASEGLSPLNRTVMAIILISILTAVLETEPVLRNLYETAFETLNFFFALVFSIEYILRLWCMGVSPKFTGGLGLIRYAATPGSILDLIATLALWGDVYFGLEGSFVVVLRLFRVLRLIAMARNSLWAVAFKILFEAIFRRKHELILSFGISGIILLFSATLLFLVEGTTQPEAFGSIPRALWWAIVTLTTIGYGDVYPGTVIGKFCAAIVAISAIAIIAMPTAIMAAAFGDAFDKIKGQG